jgi:hypothetical protein
LVAGFRHLSHTYPDLDFWMEFSPTGSLSTTSVFAYADLSVAADSNYDVLVQLYEGDRLLGEGGIFPGGDTNIYAGPGPGFTQGVRHYLLKYDGRIKGQVHFDYEGAKTFPKVAPMIARVDKAELRPDFDAIDRYGRRNDRTCHEGSEP